jgi:hypothetical protein
LNFGQGGVWQPVAVGHISLKVLNARLAREMLLEFSKHADLMVFVFILLGGRRIPENICIGEGNLPKKVPLNNPCPSLQFQWERGVRFVAVRWTSEIALLKNSCPRRNLEDLAWLLRIMKPLS